MEGLLIVVILDKLGPAMCVDQLSYQLFGREAPTYQGSHRHPRYCQSWGMLYSMRRIPCGCACLNYSALQNVEEIIVEKSYLSNRWGAGPRICLSEGITVTALLGLLPQPIPLHIVSNDMKTHIPVLFQDGYSVKDICGLLGIKKTLVCRTLRYYRDFGVIYNPHMYILMYHWPLSHPQLSSQVIYSDV